MTTPLIERGPVCFTRGFGFAIMPPSIVQPQRSRTLGGGLGVYNSGLMKTGLAVVVGLCLASPMAIPEEPAPLAGFTADSARAER